jgi:hypothetical protein
METLRRLALPLIVLALLLGVGIGLFLGWQVWPVTWYDTDPSDLRLSHKATFVLTTADSLAVTGDSLLARQRLLELTDEETDIQALANLVEQVAQSQEQNNDKAAALRVRRLANAAGLPLATAGATPTPAPKQRTTPANLSNTLVLLGALIIFVAAATIVIWALLRLFRGKRPETAEEEWMDEAEREAVAPPAPQRAERRAPSQAPPPPGAYDDPSLAARPAAQGTRPLTPVAYSSVDEDDQEEEEEEEVEEIPLEEPEEESSGEQATLVPEPPPMADNDLPPDALGLFEAEYHLGDDDFDCSYSLESEDGDFMGECGIGISDVLDVDGAQKVNAFEVWLFDKGDIRTVSKILVSDYTFENEALNARLSAKGDLVVAQTGSSFTLETLTLQVTVTITDVAYVPDDARPDAVFAQLNVEFLVERAN